MARIAGCSQAKFNRAWITVGSKFEVFLDQKLVLRNEIHSTDFETKIYKNQKMEKVRQDTAEFRKQLSLSGSKGADIRWNKPFKANGDPNGDPISDPNSKTIASYSYSYSLKDKDKKAVKDRPVDNLAPFNGNADT